MTDPIRIPVYVSDGHFRWHCHSEITPEIAGQIVAMGMGSMPINLLPDGTVRLLSEPVTAKPDAQGDEAFDRTSVLSSTEAASIRDNAACVEQARDKHGDEAEGKRSTYLRPCGICGEPVQWANFAGGAAYQTQYHDCKPVPGAKLDACRKELSEAMAMVRHNYEAEQRALSEVASLREKLTTTEISGSQAIDRLRSERDRALAELADAKADAERAIRAAGVEVEGAELPPS